MVQRFIKGMFQKCIYFVLTGKSIRHKWVNGSDVVKCSDREQVY